MGFGGILPGAGLTVRTALTNPSTRPGLSLPGRVTVTAGRSPVPIDQVALGLVTRVEPEGGAEPYVLVQFHRTLASGAFVLAPGEPRTAAFAVPVPWETPVTVLYGHCLLNLRMGLRAEVAVSPLLDRGDLRTVYVHPLPAQEGILAALAELGFQLRQVGLQAGRMPGVDQRLPFHQKIGFWAAPLYAGPFSELELTFFADRCGMEVVFALDRRVALAGAGHVSLSRFRVAHRGAAEVDWVTVVDGWIRYAVRRHGAAASGYRTSAPVPESPHVSRPPDRVRPGRGLYDTAGGESDSADGDD